MNNAFIYLTCYLLTRVTSPPYKMSLDDFIQGPDSGYDLEREDLTDEIPQSKSYVDYEPGTPPWVENTEANIAESDLEGSTANDKIVVRDVETGVIIIESDYYSNSSDQV